MDFVIYALAVTTALWFIVTFILYSNIRKELATITAMDNDLNFRLTHVEVQLGYEKRTIGFEQGLDRLNDKINQVDDGFKPVIENLNERISNLNDRLVDFSNKTTENFVELKKDLDGNREAQGKEILELQAQMEDLQAHATEVAEMGATEEDEE